MSEFLTVRLSSQKEADIPWLVWSAEQQEVIASGQVAGWEALHEIEPLCRSAQRSGITGGE